MNKQSFITILLTVLMSMVGAKAFAHDIEAINPYGQTIYYIWTNNFTELAVSFRGATDESYKDEYINSIYIPASVEYNGKTYSVTSIGEKAFCECRNITSVTIPQSITFIGDNAFKNCRSLESVYISSLEAWCGIQFGKKESYPKNECNPLLYANHLYLNGEEIKDLVIPNSVTSINDHTFYKCSGLTSVTIPSSVTSIGDFAFSDCSGLTSVTIPNSVTSIGYSAFSDCSGLTSVTIPNSVTSIGSYAFNKCSGLTSVTIGNSVTSIGSYAFYKCSGLTSITIPNSVTSIGGSAFEGCSGLTSITVENGNSIYHSSDNCNAIIEKSTNTLVLGCKNTVIPNNVNSIGNSAFEGCSGLTSVTIPNSVTSIGSYAFYKCSGLTSVTIGNSVTSIGAGTFLGCSSLTSVTIGNSVTSIGNSAFEGCSGLTSITIPNSVTSIGVDAFFYCSGLTSVISLIEEPFEIYEKYNGNFRTFDVEVFNNATLYVPVGTIDKYKSTRGWKDFSIIKEGSGPNGGGDTPDNPNPNDDPTLNGTCGQDVNFAYDKETHQLRISGTGAMADYYLNDCAPWHSYADEIESVEIASGVSSIGDFAFYQCSRITNIDLPSTVSAIGGSAFKDCTILKSLTLNEGLQIVGGSAFEGCANLTTLTIPSTVKSILINAIKNCSNLTEVYCLAETVPETDENAFDGTPTEKSTLHVPANSVDAYRSSWPWSDFKVIVAIGSTELEGISAYSSGGAVIQTNDLINSGSKLNWTFSNNSNVNVTLVSMQLIDGVTKAEGNLMSVNKLVEAGSSVSYTTTIGALGIHIPVTCRFKYNYDGSEYVTDAEYTGSIGPNPTTDIKLTIKATGNGTVKYNGSSIRNGNESFSIRYMGDASISFSPDNGNRIKFVKVNNSDVTSKLSNNQYRISLIMKNTTVEVEFEAIPNDMIISGTCGETVNFSYDKTTRTLVISGEGAISDYDNGSNKAPWYSYAKEIQKLEIESGITSIGHFAFYECSGMTSLSIPATVGYIGSSAFEECTSLTSLKLNEGLLYLGGSAFEGCTGLKAITIPSTVNTISINAFKNCKGITDVYCYAETVPETDENTFDGTPTEKSTLHVPANSIDAYQSSWPWSDFKEITALDGGVVGILEVNRANDVEAVYSIKGEKLEHYQKGINIVKMKDGTVKKIFLSSPKHMGTVD